VVRGAGGQEVVRARGRGGRHLRSAREAAAALPRSRPGEEEGARLGAGRAHGRDEGGRRPQEAPGHEARVGKASTLARAAKAAPAARVAPAAEAVASVADASGANDAAAFEG
jgi:hypothetical protein